MATNLIHDRGRGPELVDTRITVYNLLPYFFDPTATEKYVCDLYELTPEQVAAARAYVFNNLDEVLPAHMRIEERMAAGNPPEVVEQARKSRQVLVDFKTWLTARRAADAASATAHPSDGTNGVATATFPTFREWFAEQQRQNAIGGQG